MAEGRTGARALRDTQDTAAPRLGAALRLRHVTGAHDGTCTGYLGAADSRALSGER